ncbi:hypothetical protein C4K09_2331 [Pseudomonas chlororaphis subsp. aureofaciens]|nr:hypothetical protein C4K11_2436 [Pseudomonas chlororaphis subsp. aureofaciens]AZE16792.1 hypothetical protein C4K09_2331 [Pseudomonas chlororaphis subsp. aureofaciens]
MPLTGIVLHQRDGHPAGLAATRPVAAAERSEAAIGLGGIPTKRP